MTDLDDTSDEDVAWCRFEFSNSANLLRYITIYVPLNLIIIYVSYVTYKVHKEVVVFMSKDQESNERYAHVKRLRLYPLALILCYFWGNVNRLYTLGTDGQSVVIALVK